MRAKYAAQIRRGVRAGKAAVARALGDYSAPIFFPLNFTELETKAYDRTLKREIARQVAEVGKRMLKKVDGFIPEEDGAVQGVKEAVADLEKIRRGQ